jgi:hypothetical protein
VRLGGSRPGLKPAVKGFKTLQGVKQLNSGLAHRIARLSKLFGVSDGKFDSINRDATLVGHLKFHR